MALVVAEVVAAIPAAAAAAAAVAVAVVIAAVVAVGIAVVLVAALARSNLCPAIFSFFSPPPSSARPRCGVALLANVAGSTSSNGRRLLPDADNPPWRSSWGAVLKSYQHYLTVCYRQSGNLV